MLNPDSALPRLTSAISGARGRGICFGSGWSPARLSTCRLRSPTPWTPNIAFERSTYSVSLRKLATVWSGSEGSTVRFATLFPSPRVERVSPGHLVAVATAPTGSEAVVWRWYDAVVLGPIAPSVAPSTMCCSECIGKSAASAEGRIPASR